MDWREQAEGERELRPNGPVGANIPAAPLLSNPLVVGQVPEMVEPPVPENGAGGFLVQGAGLLRFGLPVGNGSGTPYTASTSSLVAARMDTATPGSSCRSANRLTM